MANKTRIHKKQTKNAKESAFWMDKLLTEKEIAQQKIDFVKKVENFKPKTQEELLKELHVYMDNIPVGKYRKFNSSDRLYEHNRRRIENAKASDFLGHPAFASATVFDDGIMAVYAMINNDPAEMGCK